MNARFHLNSLDETVVPRRVGHVTDHRSRDTRRSCTLWGFKGDTDAVLAALGLYPRALSCLNTERTSEQMKFFVHLKFSFTMDMQEKVSCLKNKKKLIFMFDAKDTFLRAASYGNTKHERAFETLEMSRYRIF